jgi:hypothetical protein
MVSHLNTTEPTEIGDMLEQAKRIRLNARRILADACALEELRRLLPAADEYDTRPEPVRELPHPLQATIPSRRNELFGKG